MSVEEAASEGVRAAVGTAEEAYRQGLLNPEDESALRAIEMATVEGSTARNEFASTYQSRRSRGLALEEHDTVAFSITTEGDVTFIADAELTLATVVVCVVDTDLLVRRQVAADGSEEQTVVDEQIVARRVAEDFVFTDGLWKLAARRLVAEFRGASSCPAA